MSPQARKAKRASAASAKARKPKVPSLIISHANGHDYALVRWQGRSYSLGRADDPGHEGRYRAFVAHLLAHGRPPGRQAGEEPSHPSYLVAELCGHYLAHCETYYRHVADGSDTGSLHRVRAALEPLLERFGRIQARDFDVAALRSYRDELVALGLARVTVNTKVGVLKQMFSWASDEGRLPPETALRLRVLRPLQRGRSPAPDGAPRRPVAWEHVEAVLPHMPRPIAGLVLAAWHTGARSNELCQLRGRELDVSGEVWQFRVPRHKTQHHDKERIVDIGPRAQQVLQPYRKLAPDAYWFSPAERTAEFQAARRAARKTPLYPSHVRHQAGRRKAQPKRAPRHHYDSHAVAHAIRKAIHAANAHLAREHVACGARGKPPRIPAWTMHQLRHAFLTRTRMELGLEAAQAVGGHGSFAMTESYTCDAARELARRAAAKIG